MSRTDYKTIYINTDFGHLAVHYKGDITSENAMLFLHGHIETAIEHGTYQFFDGDDNNLKILVDHRWFGCSTRIEKYPSLSERCEDIDIVIDFIYKHFSSVKNLNVVAYSQGATVLLLYLSRNFKQKHRISNAFALAPRLNLKEYLQWFQKNIDEIKNTGKEYSNKVYRSKGILRISKAFLQDYIDIDIFETVKSITCPTYIIRGELDDIVSKDEVNKLIEMNPDVLELIEIHSAGHHLTKSQLQELYLYIKSILGLEVVTHDLSSQIARYTPVRNTFVQSPSVVLAGSSHN